VKSPVKKKASRGRKKASLEKLLYEKSEEESKAVAQKALDNWKKCLAESRARREELRKNPPKPQYIRQQELRKKIEAKKQKQRDAAKPPPLSDYERSLSKSYKESVKARRAEKDVAQLRQQSKQPIDPLIVEGDFTSDQGGKEIDKQALEEFMADMGLTHEQLVEGAQIPTSGYDKYRTYVYGQSLVNPDNYSKLGTQMFLLNKLYLEVTKK
jgi:hypothetical protein